MREWGGEVTKIPDSSRGERLKEFFRRLLAAPPASGHDEAMRQLSEILSGVEDEMTSIPYDPAFPLNDGRMYPPRSDSQRAVSGRAHVSRYRNKRHSTLIGENSAIQIIDHASGAVVLDKPGADGHAI